MGNKRASESNAVMVGIIRACIWIIGIPALIVLAINLYLMWQASK